MNHRALKVMIVDGHPAVRRGLAALVGLMPGLRVVGPMTRDSAAARMAGYDAPDVALVDTELPDHGCVAIRWLRKHTPRTRIVALGTYSQRRAAALAAGADTFLLKDAGFDPLQAAIHGNEAESPRAAGIEAHP